MWPFAIIHCLISVSPLHVHPRVFIIAHASSESKRRYDTTKSHSRLHFAPRHARSLQRVAPNKDKSHSRLHFAHSTRTISTESCPQQKTKSRSRLHFASSTRTISAKVAPDNEIALSLAFRALDTYDLRRNLRRTKPNRTLACISRVRRARSPEGCDSRRSGCRHTRSCIPMLT